jgi:hypothetical protein
MKVSTMTFSESVLANQKSAWKIQKNRLLKRGARLPGERGSLSALHDGGGEAISNRCLKDEYGTRNER